MNVLKAQIKDTKAKIIICSYISRKTVSQALLELGLSNKVQVIILEKAQGQDEPISEPGFKFFQDFIHGQKFYSLKSERLRDDDVFVIFWSSGTTGNPKGIQHDVNYARHMIKGYITRGKLSPLFSKYLQTTCYFHIGGFISPLNTMSAPLTFVFNHSQDLDELHSTNDLLLKEIDLYKPYLMICGSHHLVQLSTVVGQISTEKLDLSSVELVMPMGSTIPLTLFEDLKKFLPNLNHVYQIYGMTEIGGTLAWSFNARNLGVVHPDAALKIVDPETGETCGPHQVGEIWAKTSAFMRGYLNNPAETLKFFATNGFAHTGDLGHYDEDGIIFFDGRLKDLIKYKNCHLYPIEIENIICTHPDVIEAGVFGKPDPSVQECVTALVVKVPNSKVTEQNIIDLVAEQADDAKKLRGGVKFVEKLPKNPQGKIVRRKLIEML